MSPFFGRTPASNGVGPGVGWDIAGTEVAACACVAAGPVGELAGAAVLQAPARIEIAPSAASLRPSPWPSLMGAVRGCIVILPAVRPLGRSQPRRCDQPVRVGALTVRSISSPVGLPDS